MMNRPCAASLALLASTVLFSIRPAVAEEITNLLPEETATPQEHPAAAVTTEDGAIDPTEPPSLILDPQSEILSLDEVEQPATTVDEWLTQLAQAELVEITNVRVEETADGFTLRLETTGELAAPETSVTGNAIIADIPNAVLNLAAGDEFFASDPAEGIALINVTNLPDNQVRIAITGTDAPPTADIRVGPVGLTVSGTLGNPTAQAPDDESIQVIVTGEQGDDDYFVPNASTATRTDTPILETPATIQVIPRQVLEDQQVTSLEEALRNAASVSTSTNEGIGTLFEVRGFTGAPLLVDGFRSFIDGTLFQPLPETANLEQIEILRGPASILYGEIQPGGVINLVSKRPLSEPFYEAELQVGSRTLIRPRIDFSGPLTEDGSLLYRLNALVSRQNSFRGLDTDLQRRFIAPTLTWNISDRTSLTVNLDYLENEQPTDYGRVASGNDVLRTPRDFITGEPGDRSEYSILNVGYDFEHRFSDNWSVRNAFRYIGTDRFASFNLPSNFDPVTGIITRLPGVTNVDADSYSLQTYAIGEFATGAIDHTLLFGVDLNRTVDTLLINVDFFNPTFLDISNPVYGQAPPPNSSLPAFSDVGTTQKRLGIYLQDQIEIFDGLNLLAGIRYDTVEQITQRGPTIFTPTSSETEQNDDAFTPRVGILYQPIPSISLFASYSESFTPNSGTDINGNVLEPERGRGWEAGIKAELLGGDLFATLTYFDVTKQNVATADPNDPLAMASIATGEQRSQGIELDISGEILPGWNIFASYAYIDAEVTEDNTIDVGNRLAGIPEHSASLWTTYQIQSGDLEGLGFGAGINFVGDRQGDLANTFEMDSYLLTNAAIFYDRDNWRAAINFRNIGNADYETGTPSGRTRIGVGEPFTIVGSFSIEF